MIKKFITILLLISSTAGNLAGKTPIHPKQNTDIKRSGSHIKSSIKLAFHAAKIMGALGLVYGNYKVFKTLGTNSYQSRLKLNPKADATIQDDILTPKTLHINNNGAYSLTTMAHPPYLLTVALATYLVYDGCSGICKTIKHWKSDHEIRVHRKR